MIDDVISIDEGVTCTIEIILKTKKKSKKKMIQELFSKFHKFLSQWRIQNKPKDNRVIPDPIDDRKFQEWKESGKSGILLGITLNPRKLAVDSRLFHH